MEVCILMGITPLEINNKEFKRSFRGYDIDEVDDFLDQVVEDYEKLYKENAALRDKLNSLTEKLEHYTKIEATLQNTLVLAQGAADQAKSNSLKESELIIKNANDTAQKIIDQAHTEVVRITGEYEKIKQEFQLFKTKYKNFIQTQLDLLSEIDTVNNAPKNSVIGDSQFRIQDTVKKPVDLKPESSNDIGNKISDLEIKPAVFQEKASEFGGRSGDFKTKTIDFGSKLNEFTSNFDDFDDEENNTY